MIKRLVSVIGNLLIASLLFMGLTGCGSAPPTAAPADVIAPKQLATVYILPTAVSTRWLSPTPTVTFTPSATRVPPTPTPTATAYVGVFMGDGSAPVVLPTASLAALVDVTLIPPTPLGVSAATAVPGAAEVASAGGGYASGGAVQAPGVAALAGTPNLPALPVPSANTGPGIPLPANCGTAVDNRFSALYQQYGLGEALGCAIGAGQSLPMAGQVFENGLMIWVSNNGIFVLTAQPVDGQPNTFWQVADVWHDGMPADDPSLTVPDGLNQPIRGFGLAWRTQTNIRSALGWAVGGEDGYTGMLQQFENGWMITTPEGTVYGLPLTDASSGRGQYVGPL